MKYARPNIEIRKAEDGYICYVFLCKNNRLESRGWKEKYPITVNRFIKKVLSETKKVEASYIKNIKNVKRR
jgi:hypothetical protein